MKKKILFFTGSRADYGILKPLIAKVIKKNYAKVELAAAGQHFSKTFGNTYQQILKDKIKINVKKTIKLRVRYFKLPLNTFITPEIYVLHKGTNKAPNVVIIMIDDVFSLFAFSLI